ncbi:hypothetical protein F5B21DRAFT_520702 [Xylaria acuta]|nr:hypothetical protein F5B21DRAFT_520702 [Xylaria acuta]
MPGIVALTRPGTGHHPSATTEPLESDPHNISTKKYRHPDSELRRVQKSSEVRLANPFSTRKRRKIVKNTIKLIERRNRLDRQVLREVEEKNPDVHDLLSRDKLLRSCDALRKQEQYHLGKRTRKLAKLKALWRRDPSPNRYNDYSLVRELLWRFKRNLGPLVDGYTNHHSEGGTDGDKMSHSDSASGSEWIDTSESEDEELRPAIVVANSPSLSKRKFPKDPDSHSRNKNAIKDTNRGVTPSPRVNRGKRKREKEPTESKPSKKDVALNHEMNSEGLEPKAAPTFSRSGTPPGRGALDTGEVPTVDRSSDQRRLDEMIKEHFKNIDALVYDTPNLPLRLRKKKHVDNGDPCYMSGALSTDPSPSKVKGSSSIARSTGGMKIGLTNRCEPMQRSDLVSKPIFHPNLKSTNKSAKKGEEGDASLNQSGSGNKQVRAGRNQNESTPSPSGSSPSNSSSERSEEDGEPVQNGARLSSRQVRPSSSRRETPVPAPQPWTGLGIPNPFTDHLLHTPTNRGQPRPLQTVSTPQTEEKALSLSKPLMDGCRIPVKEFSEPESSPLKGFPRSKANRDKKRKRENNKKHSDA